MTFIEGPRNTGKTFLLSRVLPPFRCYKFPFPDIYSHFKMGKEDGHGLALGKDLQILHLMKYGFIREPMLCDRGFLSTAVYGVLNKRFNKGFGNKYLEYISSNYGAINVQIVLIMGQNPVTEKDRQKKDGWEKLEYKEQLDMYDYFISSGLKVHRFTNTFKEDAIASFNTLLRNIHEYK